MRQGAAHDALRRVALFRDLAEEELEALGRQVVTRRHTRNELLFSQGDTGDGLYIVAAGQISIGRQSPEGDELIFALYEPGEYFGELALFDQGPRAAGATVVEDATLLYLSSAAFRAFIDAHPGALWTCMRVVVAQLRRCTDLADEIALLDVRSRLARRLLRLAGEGAAASGPASAVRITQQQLAGMTGATRESVNKHLRAFEADGLVRLDRGRIRILDRPRLEACGMGLD